MGGNRILPPTYLFSFIAMMVVLHFLYPAAKVVPYPWQFLGGIPLLLGIALNLMADRELNKHHTTVKPFEESTALITTGVFHLSRHPMYLGMVLILIAIVLFLGTLTPFVVIPIFMILMDRIFIRIEELMLEEKFGDTWLAYKKEVRQWV